MRRTERLFALTEYLRGRRTGVTAEQLAERFEVTVRTIYRDLDALRAASLPLEAERGRGGGYALDRSYALPPVNFTVPEAAMLVLAGRWIEEMRLLPFVDTLRSAVDKVNAALPTRSQRELEVRMRSLSFVGVPSRAPADAVRKTVERAWYDGLPLRVVYEGSPQRLASGRRPGSARPPRQGMRERSEHRIRIRNVVLDRGETLLNCDDLDRSAPRQLRLHRIVAAALEP
jgi:predicted DNA-binding transcriptional regulator YafY